MLVTGRFNHSKIVSMACMYHDIKSHPDYGEDQATAFIQFHVPEQLQEQTWNEIRKLEDRE